MPDPSCTPDTRDLFVQEYEFVVEKTGDTTTVQYFCNRDNEPVYFPDRTLATLFQVNLSTLRGRFNRMTKKHEGYRLLISEKSKTRLSSLHFINWGTENFVDTDVSRSASPLHGLVALNHIVLVNYALAEWIAYNHERLGTSIYEIENNLKKVNLTYTRTNNVIHILQKRPPFTLPSPLYRHANTSNNNTNNTHPNNTSNTNNSNSNNSNNISNTSSNKDSNSSSSNSNSSNNNNINNTNSNKDRLVPRRHSTEDTDANHSSSPSVSPVSSPVASQPHIQHPQQHTQQHTPPLQSLLNPIPSIHPHSHSHSLPIRKRSREESWCGDMLFKSTIINTNSDLVPIHPHHSPSTSSPSSWDHHSMYNLPKLMRLDNQGVFTTPFSTNSSSGGSSGNSSSSDCEDSFSDNGSPRTPASPQSRWPSDNTIQCTLDGESICHRLDLSCLEGFGSLRTALSALFRVNSFNILYQTILDAGYLELNGKDNSDEEKWQQFLSIVKKISVKPFSVTPQLKNLLS